ncbi:nuclear transport factor 2 family protein [Nocardioides sp.]|uniref:nuclear transport factor 2 family protein n=1 Tax=Nocardioides sp. TaxID=35761 RepID=UPI00351459DA
MTCPGCADHHAVEDLLHDYADAVDAGDFARVGALFARGRLFPLPGSAYVVEGADAVTALYTATTRVHPDTGTPGTQHLVGNVRVRVDAAAGTATASSRFQVTQARPDLPLQVIATGRYADTFTRHDDGWWFTTRTIDLQHTGDLSQHLLVEV